MAVDGATPRRRERIATAALTVALLAVAVLGFIIVATRAVPSAPEMRFEITTPASTDASLAMSADGQQIAFVATDAGRPRLWIRSLSSTSARPLRGTDGAAFPFWAPNGRSIGFFADDGKLKRIDIDGGAVRVLANAQLQWGGAWNSDDTILSVRLPDRCFAFQPQVANRQSSRSSSRSSRTTVIRVSCPMAIISSTTSRAALRSVVSILRGSKSRTAGASSMPIRSQEQCLRGTCCSFEGPRCLLSGLMSIDYS